MRIIAHAWEVPGDPGEWHIVQLHDVLRLGPGRVRVSRANTVCGSFDIAGPLNVDLHRETVPPAEPTCLACANRGMSAIAAADIREAVAAGEARAYIASQFWDWRAYE